MDIKDHEEKISCFILDDEPDAIDRLKILTDKINILKVTGKETDPGRAVASMSELKPEIVFLDIVMAGKTGFEVIEALREKGINPCFIFVTAHDNYSINAIKASAFDYLLKPVDIDELKETIRRYETVRPFKNLNNVEKTHNFDCLSSREKEIIQYIIEGKTSQEISETLSLSKNTIDTHRRNILEKTGLKSTNDLIRHYLST
ncbi:MAG: response regulator transcription factor [bacterium]